MHTTYRPTARFSIRIVAVVAACLVAFVATACEPPPPADGRDLGITLDAPLPTTVAPGATIEVTGTVTNHGTVVASLVTFNYAITDGFVVDDVELGVGATCASVSATHVSCAIAEMAPVASRPFTLHATAGAVSVAQTHVVGVSSNGSEPAVDPNPNAITFPTQVWPAAADPVSLAMGGPHNFLGTGPLLGLDGTTGFASEEFFLSVNTYCSDKINGDRYQSAFRGTCSGAPNDDYRPWGYDYSIDVPEGRSSDLDVRLWDARFSPSSPPELPSDRYFGGYGAEPYSFVLLGADATPFDHGDNPVVCSKTFAPTTPFDGYTFLGSARWNTLCSISPTAPAGRYVLRVQNAGSAPVRVNGENDFGIVASYASAGTNAALALCDRRLDALCPQVSGAGTASVRMVGSSPLMDAYLAEIPASAAGKFLKIELFDPGEGGQLLRIMRPSGTSAWTPTGFSWSSGQLAGSGTHLDVTNSKFNGKVVTILIDLTDYAPPASNEWWKIEYQFAGGTVTDRTTWDASIIDPPPPPL